MINENQEKKISERVKATLEVFFENNGLISDNALADILIFSGIKTSSSTVGRDLVSERAEQLIGKERIEHIKKMRELNKTFGQIKGGTNSIFYNDVVRDEDGKFKGSSKRHG